MPGSTIEFSAYNADRLVECGTLSTLSTKPIVAPDGKTARWGGFRMLRVAASHACGRSMMATSAVPVRDEIEGVLGRRDLGGRSTPGGVLQPREASGHYAGEPLPPHGAARGGFPLGDLCDSVCVDYGVGPWGFACIFPEAPALSRSDRHLEFVAGSRAHFGKRVPKWPASVQAITSLTDVDWQRARPARCLG